MSHEIDGRESCPECGTNMVYGSGGVHGSYNIGSDTCSRERARKSGENMSEHSPTPWTLHPDGFYHISAADGDEVVGDAESGMSIENQAFAVHCVNLHDELVAMIEEVQYCGFDDFGATGICPVCQKGNGGHEPDCRLADLLRRAKEIK